MKNDQNLTWETFEISLNSQKSTKILHGFGRFDLMTYISKDLKQNGTPSIKRGLMKTINLVKLANRMLEVTGFFFLLYALYSAWYGQVEPFAFLGMAVPGTIKGLEKLKKGRISVHEANVKSGNPYYALTFAREEGEEVLMNINMLLAAAGMKTSFAWPSQNPNKERFLTVGVSPQGYKVLHNYIESNVVSYKEAKDLGHAIKAEKVAEKEAKKATKGTRPNSVVDAKIQALKDFAKDGIITSEQLLAELAKLQ